MMRSMFASVVGLRVHQTRMDVIGNNVANVNTVGYKAARATFADLFSQTLRGASSPTADSGGTNPMQVGLGVGLASIDVIMTPGTLQLTGKETDMAIEGDGFFVLSQGDQFYFTRAGAFTRDAAGYLVNPQNGFRLQGWMANPDGTFPTRDRANLQDIRIPTGLTDLPKATTLVTFGQSLDAESPVGTEYVTSATIFDSLGQEHTIIFKFRKVAANEWDVGFFASDGTTALRASDRGTVNGRTGGVDNSGTTYQPESSLKLIFNPDGTIQTIDVDGDGNNDPPYASFEFDPQNGAVSPMTINVDFSLVNQPAIPGSAGSTLEVLARDGYAMGSLETFSIDSRGVVFGVFSNGQRRPIAQVALAVFPNPDGLLRLGGNLFVTSANSGLEQIGEPGTGGRGSIAPANLEMSNVDLSAEFTNLIITQRGFQANSRVITASDEMLQDLVNLKR